MTQQLAQMLSGSWIGAVVIGALWALREVRANKKQDVDVNSQFAQLMMQRERELFSRIERLETETADLRRENAELRLTLVKNGIDTNGSRE